MEEKLMSIVRSEYVVQNWVDYEESERTAYLRFIHLNEIWTAAMNKGSRQVCFYKLERNVIVNVD